MRFDAERFFQNHPELFRLYSAPRRGFFINDKPWEPPAALVPPTSRTIVFGGLPLAPLALRRASVGRG
jgi:hypothetical protein